MNDTVSTRKCIDPMFAPDSEVSFYYCRIIVCNSVEQYQLVAILPMVTQFRTKIAFGASYNDCVRAAHKLTVHRNWIFRHSHFFDQCLPTVVDLEAGNGVI